MLEDYWLPRREGGKGTEVTTLAGGQNLSQMDDVLYFQKKLYRTLNVPQDRLDSDTPFSLGRTTEITRDEIKFNRFVNRLRNRFATMFTKMLEKQLVLKQIMSIEDFQNIAADIRYEFAKDNFFSELKEAEIIQNRVQVAQTMQDLVGKYYSHEWLRKNILQQSDDDIEEMDEQIAEEKDNPQYMDPMLAGMDPNMMGDPNMNPQDGGIGAEPPLPAQERNVKKEDPKAKYDILSQKKNRTLSDEADLKSAAQKIGKK
jgi:hypothetical protein